MNVCVNMYLKHHTRWKGLFTIFTRSFCIRNFTRSLRFNLVRLQLLWVSYEVFYVLKSRAFYQDMTLGARSIRPKFPEISVQNSMDRFGPTGKVSKKRVHLLRWSSFPGRTGLNFG